MSVYITYKSPAQYRQLTLDDLLFGPDDLSSLITSNRTGTVTYVRDTTPRDLMERFDADKMIIALMGFLDKTETLRAQPRDSLYRTFYIPKQHGGLRRIDAPNDELSDALRTLWLILESVMTETYHTSAFAYIKGRSRLDAVKRHQQNDSRWFAKFDLHNFFGSTSPEFLLKMLSMIYPYSEVMKTSTGRRTMAEALDLCFKDGGLPQGTPISPFLTNLMMIPIDYTLANGFRSFPAQSGKQTLVFTRYADDFIVSSRYGFSFRQAEEMISSVLASFDAPFQINKSKTRYGSRNGSNWNLGVLLNKDNEITIGRKKKKQFESMLHSYCMDKKNGIKWDIHDVQVMEGLRSCYTNVEGEVIDRIIAHIGSKCGVDIRAEIKKDLYPES